jgi:hypothetical protein
MNFCLLEPFVEPNLRNTDIYYCAAMRNYWANASWLTIFFGRTSRKGVPEKRWGIVLEKNVTFDLVQLKSNQSINNNSKSFTNML